METIKTPINNAGLVILAAFLPAYFERLGLVANGKFVSVITQNRALYLLQYLVYDINYTQAANDNLSLNKILVGLPVNAPEQFIFTITEAEKELSESLLFAVTQQWDKFKSSSIKAMQASFFIREGLMTMNQNSFTLQVESRSFDILTDSIPWNFNVIKLSWMEMPLYVEW